MSLRDAIEQHIANNTNFDNHSVRLEELRVEFSHSIELLEFDEDNEACNCVMYAMNFRLFPASRILFENFYADTAYLNSLIEQGHLIGRESNVGSLAVYYRDSREQHSGIVTEDGRIKSKWGTGFLYEHGLWEVPSSYGTSIRYFDPIACSRAIELLRRIFPVIPTGACQCGPHNALSK